MNGRDAFLARIRSSLGVSGVELARRQAVAARLADAPRGIIPKRGELDQGGRADLFCALAERVHATVVRVCHIDDVPGAVADYLRQHNLPARVATGGDARLAAMDWSRAPQVERRFGPATENDPTSLSHAEAGIAESGTLMLVSGPENPTTLNFLPETHVVVVDAKDVVGSYEEAVSRYRPDHPMPRTINFITGPSRSADIEQTLLLGAHGPRRLHIILVENE